MRDAEPYEPGSDSEREPLEPPDLPADETPDDYDEPDTGALRITSLRPVTRPFSMRRLLNWGALIVAVITLLALAIAWLPGVVAQHAGSPSARNGSSVANDGPRARGDGWLPIGPAWAQDVAFAADGRTGYMCGPTGLGDTPILVARFAVATAPFNP